MNINLNSLLSLTIETFNNLLKADESKLLKKILPEKLITEEKIISEEDKTINNQDIIANFEAFQEKIPLLFTRKILERVIKNNPGYSDETLFKDLYNFLKREFQSLRKEFTSKKNILSFKGIDEIEQILLKNIHNNNDSLKNFQLLLKFINIGFTELKQKTHFDILFLEDNKFILFKVENQKNPENRFNLSFLINTKNYGIVEAKITCCNKSLSSSLIFENRNFCEEAKKYFQTLKKEGKLSKSLSGLNFLYDSERLEKFFIGEAFSLNNTKIDLKI
ncbi:hypothetical protein [Thermovenabulum sp.]|uniref:hypothetical protein n=1 Tax=Thermovenabulum sp. TaxID=3100335 RepID=UPI003C7A6045